MSEHEKTHESAQAHTQAQHVKHDFNISSALYIAIAALVLVLAVNQYFITSISNQVSFYSAPAGGAGGISVGSSSASPGGVNLQAITDNVIPKGVPEVYGSELGVSYDKPVESLTILGKLDGDLYPDGQLKFSGLNENTQKRYVALGKMIACEYCCGATELVFANGQPACGCQHSAAMRGLAMYLLKNHSDVSDEKILEEMAKWKILFFPKQHISKAVSFASAGMDSNINPTDLASNEFRGFKASQATQGSSQNIANAPDMVGGC